MKRVLIALIVSVFVVSVASTSAVSLFAHHGRGTTYVTDRMVELKGTVNKVQWRNPHIQFLIDVKGADGKVVTWTIEHSNVSTLARLGYGRDTLQAGMEVTAVVYPGSMDRPIGLCRKVILADGTAIFQRGVADGERYNPLNDID
jgi:hypothetical protein